MSLTLFVLCFSLAEEYKKDGNEAYKSKDYVRARELYTKAIGE